MADLDGTTDWAILHIMLLRLRALLARARGDDLAYRDLLTRYTEMARSRGFEQHVAWAEAMTEGALVPGNMPLNT